MPPPIIQWYKDGSPVLLAEKTSLVSYQHLMLEDIALDQAGLYTCSADNGSGKPATAKVQSEYQEKVGEGIISTS